MNSRKIILSAIFLLSIFFVNPGKVPYASAEETGNKICKGVFIDEVDVSGMTKEEAQQAVDDFADSLRSKGVAIKIGDNVVYTTLESLGYTYEPNDNIDQALSLGKTGNLIKRYKDLKDIEQGTKVYPLTFTLDDKKLNDLIKNQVGAYNIKPVNASVTRKNGQFIYSDHVVGKKVDVEQTAKAIKDIVLNNWNRTDVVVDAVEVDDIPQYTRDIVELCNTKLGSFTTEFASSTIDRAANLANGARLINNTVLYPGETFSGYEHLTPFTADNGYYTAHAYQDGKVIDSIGGGACQVTTTLYNAALFAELEIVQRNPHSMTISYVDLSRDAAIAGTYKDLKFKNNTDAPILIQAYTKDRTITFNIWGHETRDTANRKIEYITKVLSETPPPADVITKDPTKPTTYYDVTQNAYTGYRAELYKVVYENGKEVSRTLVNKSSYAAAPRMITVGTKKVVKKPAKPQDKQDTTKDTQSNTDGNAQDNNQTQNPSDSSIETDSINQTNPDNQLQGDIYNPGLEDTPQD